MATVVQTLQDDFLSCNICTELYQDPCTLACGHTFCRSCLSTFTKTQPDAIKAKSFLCPNCRQMTKVPNPGRSVDDWVKQIKPSFLIVGLLDSFASQEGGDVAPQNPCFPCLQNDDKNPASAHCVDCDIAICNKCVKMHRAMPGTSHHVITELHEGVKVKRKRQVICKTHNSIIEFCCKDCNKAVCQKCCILDHRKCNNVVTVESIVPEMKSALNENKQIMVRDMNKIKTTLAWNENMTKEIKDRKQQIQSEIETVTQKAINVIKQKNRQLMDELTSITDKQTANLTGQKKSQEIDIQMYQQHCEFIDQIMTAQSEMDMYDMYQTCQSGAITVVSNINTSKAHFSNITKIMFEDKLDLELFSRTIQLGEITEHGEFHSHCTPILIDTISVRTESDMKNPDPVDLVVLDVNGTETMIVTDWSNQCLKSFYGRDKISCHSYMKLDANPWSVTKLTDQTVAVTFSDHKMIAIVQATPELVLRSKFTTKVSYSGLTALDESTLVTGSGTAARLNVMDSKGRVQRSITSDRGLIKWPNFLHTGTRGNILVSDFTSKSVYCLTLEGDVVFKYQPPGERKLAGPRGITSSKAGDILVADTGKNKIVQLTPSGEFVRDLLSAEDGLHGPLGICLYKDILYVAEYGKDIKVFQC